MQVAIKQASDNEQDNREASRLLNERIPRKRTSPKKSNDRAAKKSKKKKTQSPVKEDYTPVSCAAILLGNMDPLLSDCLSDLDLLQKKMKSKKKLHLIYSIRDNVMKLSNVQKEVQKEVEKERENPLELNIVQV